MSIRRRVALLLAAGLLARVANSAPAVGPGVGKDNAHQHHPTPSQAGGDAVREAKAVSPERLRERADLLKSGEAALARLDVAAALGAFERAALILHAADTEIALVRSYMQAGDYRRALGFGAHTAGAHLDVAGGSLLYAWLLHSGGQPVIAQRLLVEISARLPDDALVQAVQRQLRSGAPSATGELLAPPVRLAPYGQTQGLPASARSVGSAVLLPGGRAALMPLSLLPRSGRLWLRNGLGQLTAASVEKRLTDVDVALVRLKRPMPMATEFRVAVRDAFPGSAGFAVEYVRAPNASPAWPVLRAGFLGGTDGNCGARLLGIDMPAGSRGGPVFDGAGQFIGLALPGASAKGGDRLVTASRLNKAIGSAPLFAQATAGPTPREAVDNIYEASLRSALQVITATSMRKQPPAQ